MEIVDSIIAHFKSEENKTSDAPEGLCPVCWGTRGMIGNQHDLQRQTSRHQQSQ